MSTSNPVPLQSGSITWVHRHAELFLIVGILVVLAAVLHWIPYKIPFLNFFYLPVLAAGYLLNARRAVMTSVLCVLLVFIYFVWEWAQAWLAQGHAWASLPTMLAGEWETLLSLAMWGGFLVLMGALFATAHERMSASFRRVQELNTDLESLTGDLRVLNRDLEASATELKNHSEQLQQKNLLIEKLKNQVEETLFSTMDPTVARLSMQGRLAEEKRNLSILFCDLKGFTTYSQSRHPEVMLQDLNRFYRAMEELIETYHGHIDKYMGDGVMCEFGAPLDYEQHSLQAAVCGLKMQEKAQDMQLMWPLRVGIASGEAIVGLFGSRRRSYSALGEVVNLAKRIEEICEPGTVFLNEQCYEQAKGLISVERVRALGVRRASDGLTQDALTLKLQRLEGEPDNPVLLFEIGKLYFELREASKALGYLQHALELKPDDNEIKVAYADATVKRDEYEKIAIRGLEKKQSLFQVVSLVNPLLKSDRFPQPFLERYRHVEGLIEIPDDRTLPVEVVDGSVGHSRAVAVLSYALADQMGLAEEAKHNVLVAGRLQDLGKSGIWHSILSRRGKLSETETKDVEGHSQESVSIAKRMGYDHPAVLEIIAGHHERLDGSGYPRRARQDEIPMGARITGVADVYCALTANRPYRLPWDPRVALGELRKGAAAGKYDPAVVESLAVLLGMDTSAAARPTPAA